MLSRTKCNLSRLRSFGLLGRLRGSRDGKAKFSLLVRRVSVVTGRPHIKTNRVSGVNSKNLLHIQLDNYSRSMLIQQKNILSELMSIQPEK